MRSSKQSHARGHRAKSKQKDNSKEFDKYYSSVYGARWPALREALLKPTVHAAVANSFILPAATPACSAAGLLNLLALGPLHAYRRAKSSGPYPPPPLDPASALRVWYWLDLASVLPVLLLQPQRGHAVLDMCAAPGGKSVMVAQRLFDAQPYTAAPSASQPAAPEATAAAAAAATVTSEVEEPVASSPASVSASAARGSAQTGCDVDGEEAAAPDGTPEADQQAAAAGGSVEERRQSACGTDPRVGASAAAAAEDAPAGAAAASSADGQPPLHLPPPPPPPLSLLAPGKLVCNEPDRQRLQRLQRVLEEYLPLGARAHVEVLNYQGHAYWGRNQAGRYERVLVDAPCSSDRHVLQQAASQQRGAIPEGDWSLAGCRRIAEEQLQLCLAAMRALRVGGRLVYSTCSIAPLQNDEVVQRLLQRCGPEAARVVPPLELLRRQGAGAAGPAGAGGPGAGGGAGSRGGTTERREEEQGEEEEAVVDVAGVLGAQATQHGAICLPDRGGWGPIYVAVVDKVGEVGGMGAVGTLRPQPTGRSDDEEEEEEDEEEEGFEG